jgi:hypothetical protein
MYFIFIQNYSNNNEEWKNNSASLIQRGRRSGRRDGYINMRSFH